VHEIVLGIVQGLTEFLPISSSGHLVLVPGMLGWEEPPLGLTVMLHLGTLVAIRAVAGVPEGKRARTSASSSLALGVTACEMAGPRVREWAAGEAAQQRGVEQARRRR
jgi:hypothetical protein